MARGLARRRGTVRRRFVIASWLLWCLLAAALPAYANNPPAPDGMFGLLLIFPLVIVGWRLAGVTPTEKERKWRIVKGVVLALCVLAALPGAAGGIFILVGLVCVLAYGIGRGVQVIKRGQGKKRVVIGLAIILFTPFAVSNLVLSTEHDSQSDEPAAIAGVRTIVSAEQTFRSNGSQDKNKNRAGKYASLEQLVQAGLIDADLLGRETHRDYQFAVVLSGDPDRDAKEFFVYATPVKYSRGADTTLWSFFPGASWVAIWHPAPHLSRRTFASDESGVIRQADLGSGRVITRQEAQKWPPLK